MPPCARVTSPTPSTDVEVPWAYECCWSTEKGLNWLFGINASLS
jgi:hypothetical protein